MLVHHRVTPSINLPVPIYTLGVGRRNAYFHNKYSYLCNRDAVVQILWIIFMNVFLLPVLDKQHEQYQTKLKFVERDIKLFNFLEYVVSLYPCQTQSSLS